MKINNWKILGFLFLGTALATSITIPVLTSNKDKDSLQPQISADIPNIIATNNPTQKPSVAFENQLDASNKQTYDKLKNLHEQLQKDKEAKLGSLKAKIDALNNYFQHFRDNIASGYDWDYWSNVENKLKDNTKFQNKIANWQNGPYNTFEKFKLEKDFLQSVQSQNLEESTMSKFRSWLVAIEAEFTRFNEQVDIYQKKAKCLDDKKSAHNYFYKSDMQACLDIK